MKIAERINLLLDAEIIESEDQVKELSIEDDYFEDLFELESFFQSYMEDEFRFENAVFIFGSSNDLNAWAWKKNNVSAICINYSSTKLMRDFFDIYLGEVIFQLCCYRITPTYDNGLAATIIMQQVSEMFLFYHEAAHLIQAQEPVLLNVFTEEEIRGGTFDIIDHVSEMDADLYACRRLATHLLRITDRQQGYIDKTKYLEDLVIVTIIGYMIYRLILSTQELTFYLKKKSHPHMSVRMTHVIINLTQATINNTSFRIDRKRIVTTSMSILEELGVAIPEYIVAQKYVDEGKANHKDILHYIHELQGLINTNPASANNKTSKIQYEDF